MLNATVLLLSVVSLGCLIVIIHAIFLLIFIYFQSRDDIVRSDTVTVG